MQKQKNYYEMFGVSKNASEAEIKKRYRKLAKKHHPDKNRDDPEKAKIKFQKLQTIYDVLSDSEKRKLYDECGKLCVDGTKTPQDNQRNG